MIFSTILQLRDLANGFGHVLYISAKTDIAYATRHCLPSPSPPLSLSLSLSACSSRADFNAPAFQFVSFALFHSDRVCLLDYCLSAEAAVIKMLIHNRSNNKNRSTADERHKKRPQSALPARTEITNFMYDDQMKHNKVQ